MSASKWNRALPASIAHGCKQEGRLLRAPSNGLCSADELRQPGRPMKMSVRGTAILSSLPQDVERSERFGYGSGWAFRIQRLIDDSRSVAPDLLGQPCALRYNCGYTGANGLSQNAGRPRYVAVYLVGKGDKIRRHQQLVIPLLGDCLA